MHAQWKCCEHFIGRHVLEAHPDHTQDETSAYRHITLSHDGIYEIYLRAFPIPYICVISLPQSVVVWSSMP